MQRIDTSIPQFKRMARAVKHVLYQDSSCNVNVELDSTSRKPFNVVQIYMWIYNDIIYYNIIYDIYNYIPEYINNTLTILHWNQSLKCQQKILCPTSDQKRGTSKWGLSSAARNAVQPIELNWVELCQIQISQDSDEFVSLSWKSVIHWLYYIYNPWRIHGAAIYGNMDPINIPPLC